MKRSKLSGTLTVRLSAQSLKVLRARAKKAGRTTSDLARELLEQQADTRSIWERTKQHVGAVSSGPRTLGGRRAREILEDWNPDRRG